jgi:hypothetical protein
MKKPGSEEYEQKSLFKILELYPEINACTFAIANGGSRHILEAVNLKKMGLKPGILDIFMAIPSRGFHGLFIEMKCKDEKKAKVSKNQIYYIKLFREQGYAAEVTYGCDEAWNLILFYLEKSKREMMSEREKKWLM